MWLVFAILLAVLILLGVIVAARALPWVLTQRRRRVVVVLDGDQSLGGIMYRRRGPLVELRDVSLLREGGAIGVDGSVLVEQARIVWVQVPG